MEINSTLFTGLAIGLTVAGFLMFAAGELLVAGVCFLSTSLTLYARESAG